MFWTDEERAIEKIESFPKMYMDDKAYQRVYGRIQNEEIKLQKKKKRMRRVRWSAWASVSLVIIVFITSLFVTESGRNLAWNAWLQLNSNIVTLEDGVIAKFSKYTITEADFENGLNSTALAEELKILMVYEEAISKGFEPNMQSVEEAFNNSKASYESLIREDVVNQYFVYLFGTPHFPVKQSTNRFTLYYERYIQETNAYKDLSFKRYLDEVVFNKAYDDEFEWKSFIETSLGTAHQSQDVLVSYLGRVLLMISTPDFQPDTLSTQELEQRIGYEIFYQEALANHYRPDKKELDKVDQLQKQYYDDPQVYDQIQREMQDRGLSEAEYWNQLKLKTEQASVVKKYIGILFPDTMRMNEEELQKALHVIANEYFQRAKSLLVFNDRMVSRYDWDVKAMTTVGNDNPGNYVVAEFRGYPVYSFELGNKKFNKYRVDYILLNWISLELIKERGNEFDEKEYNNALTEIDQNIINSDESRIAISEFLRNTGLLIEHWDEYKKLVAELYAFVSQINKEFFPDTYMSSQVLKNFQEKYKELWDEVKYNHDYPLID